MPVHSHITEYEVFFQLHILAVISVHKNGPSVLVSKVCHTRHTVMPGDDQNRAARSGQLLIIDQPCAFHISTDGKENFQKFPSR